MHLVSTPSPGFGPAKLLQLRRAIETPRVTARLELADEIPKKFETTVHVCLDISTSNHIWHNRCFYLTCDIGSFMFFLAMGISITSTSRYQNNGAFKQLQRHLFRVSKRTWEHFIKKTGTNVSVGSGGFTLFSLTKFHLSRTAGSLYGLNYPTRT